MGDVKVTALDRELFVELCGDLDDAEAAFVARDGRWDNDWRMQLLARHRIAAMEEAAARCDEAAEAYRICARLAPESDVFQCTVETAELLAAAIRERIDQ